MNNFFKLILIFSYVIIALACSQLKETTGKAILSGKFSGYFPVEKNFSVKLTVPNLVETSKQLDEYETQIETDGSFSLSIPLFCSVYGMLSINDENSGAFFLSPDQETKISLSLNGVLKNKITGYQGNEVMRTTIEKLL